MATKPQQVELRKLKVAAHLSEETTAFTAEVWVGGVLAAHARNDGCGGCNGYYRADGGAYAALEAEAKRRFPDELEALDLLVSDLMERIEDQKAVARFAKKGFPHVVKIFTDKHEINGKVFWLGATLTAYKDPSQLDAILKEAKAEKHEVLTAKGAD